MLRLLKLLLIYKLKGDKPRQKIDGFTLLELLIGLILAFLIITPLLGFLVNLLNTDRQEQAKAQSEQEIQAALSYIARDLDQSVFIYDGLGLTSITPKLPSAPSGTTGAPVLVFWKRQFLPNSLPVDKNGTSCAAGNSCDDSFVYALVAYYLLRDNTCATTSNWSCTTRIARIQLQDALFNKSKNATLKPAIPNNFVLFSFTASGSFEEKMNEWPYTSQLTYDANNPQFETLIDYIDQTPSTVTPAPPFTACPTTPREEPRPDGATKDDPYPSRQVPPTTTPLLNTGFYACVSTDKTLAQVFIRGNALARLRPKTQQASTTYVASQSAYFPKATIQVQGRGLLNDTSTGQ